MHARNEIRTLDTSFFIASRRGVARPFQGRVDINIETAL